MSFSCHITKLLDADLNRANVKQRSQAGRSLSYIESWHAIAEANRIFGFDGWSSETVDIRAVSERERKIGARQVSGWGVTYTARVRVSVYAAERGWIIREGVGSGHGIDQDLGQAHESAIKEAESDARKRALMTFGNQFGLALYDKEQRHVSDDPIEDEVPNTEPKSPIKPTPSQPRNTEVPAEAGPSTPAPTKAAASVTAARPDQPLTDAIPTVKANRGKQPDQAKINGSLEVRNRLKFHLDKIKPDQSDARKQINDWLRLAAAAKLSMTTEDQKGITADYNAKISEIVKAERMRIEENPPRAEQQYDPDTGEVREAAE